ncbi:MAG TPA: MarR family transcriptional regulator [Gammaproteobacteria bacterium]|nr:MarR family transcriptional regulator [Gammaproteobacteria bacterium]
MKKARPTRQQLAEAITDQLARRHSTAMVLFHHALAERLELGPTDHKCLDLLRENPNMSASNLAAATGLTTGAITGVVARLERSGFLSREPDPADARKQVLRALPEGVARIRDAVAPLRRDLVDLLDAFDADQLAAIKDFLAGSTELALRHASLLRARPLLMNTARGRTRA